MTKAAAKKTTDLSLEDKRRDRAQKIINESSRTLYKGNGFSAAIWVPEKSAQDFLNLHRSLHFSLQSLKKTGMTLIFNPKLSRYSAIAMQLEQMDAIKALLTDSRLENFWRKLPLDHADKFFYAWHQMFNDWATIPRITLANKKKKVSKAAGYVQKILDCMDEDPCLQSEIGYAVAQAGSRIYGGLEGRKTDQRDAYNIQQAGSFVSLFKAFLDEVQKPDYRHFTHTGFPVQIKQDGTEMQFFMRQLSPWVHIAFGERVNEETASIINTVFPHLSVTGEQVRDAIRGKRIKK